MHEKSNDLCLSHHQYYMIQDAILRDAILRCAQKLT